MLDVRFLRMEQVRVKMKLGLGNRWRLEKLANRPGAGRLISILGGNRQVRVVECWGRPTVQVAKPRR